MPTTPELVLDLGQLRPQAFLDRDALDPEPSATGSRTDVREPEEIERLRFAQPSTFTIGGGTPPELDQPASCPDAVPARTSPTAGPARPGTAAHPLRIETRRCSRPRTAR